MRRHARGVVLLAVLAVLLGSLGATLLRPAQTTAATDSTINFQARLESSTGAIVPDGTYNIEFKLYDASSSSGSSQGSCTGDVHCLWTEKYQNSASQGVQVVDGYLSVPLGSITPFPSTINWDQQLYLTMNVGGTGSGASPTYDGEMSPRLALTAVPYAFRAGQLAKLTGANTSVLDWAAQTAARSILLPDENGTLCIRSSTSCGFAASTGATGYIQNTTTVQTGANFAIQSTGTTNVTALIKQNTSQAADLLQFQNSSGNKITGFDSSGKLQFADGAGGAYDTNLYRSGAGVLKTDGTLNVVTDIQLNGVSINTPSTLSNVAYLTATSQTFTGVNAFSRSGTGTGDYTLGVTGLPVNDATSSLIRIGNAIAGGNSSTNGGTWLSVNAPSSGTGVAADFVNFQNNGSLRFKVDSTGIISTNQNLQLTNSSLTTGNISKTFTVGTGGVTANDVVVLANDGGNTRVIDSTTARDPRVLGVANATTVSGSTTQIKLLGNFQVTADTGAVAIGDQLVVSSTSGQVTVDNNATTGILGYALSAKAGGSSGLVSIFVRPVGGQTNPNIPGNLTVQGTINSATISGGNISGGTLSSTAVNSLNVSGTAISGTGALTVDANGANTIGIGGISTGDILLGGGSGSTGCTLTNNTGDFTCTGNITGASTGTVGYWSRSGTTLQPATAGDAITTSGNISTSGSGTITSASTVTGTSINGTTGINTGAGAGTQRIDNVGNLANIVTISAGVTSTAISGTNLDTSLALTASPASAPGAQTDFVGIRSTTSSASANANSNTRLFGASTNTSFTGSGTLGTSYGNFMQSSNAGSGTIATAFGGNGVILNSSNGNFTTGTALQGTINSTGTGTISSARALDANIINNGGGTLTSAYGLKVETPTNTGVGSTIGTAYGVFIGEQSAATTNNYGLYFAGTAGTAIDGISWNGDTTLYRSAAGELTSNGNLVLQGGSLLTNQTTANLFNATATTLNIGGAVGAGGIVLAGGSGSTGCTLDGSTGNFTCSGSITGSSTGTVGYWTRSGTTLQPATAGDAVTTSGNISTSGTGTITSAGLLTGQAGLTVTGGTANINASGSGATNIGSTGSGGAVAIQSASTIAVTSGTTLSLTSTGSNNINITPGGGTNTGVLVKPTTDSTAAFQIQNAATTPVLSVDTTNSMVIARGIKSDASVGSEMFTASESFPATAGWTAISGTGSSATATHTNGGGTTALSPTPALTIVAGATYQISFTITGSPGASVTPQIGGSIFGAPITGNDAAEVQVFTALNTGNLTFTPTNTWTGTISNVSVKLVTTTNAAVQLQNSAGSTVLEIRTANNSSGTGGDTFIGLSSGTSNTTGNLNTALGAQSLQFNTTGFSNTAIGNEALIGNTTGSNNTAVGTCALCFNTTGGSNTANGSSALLLNTTGSFNTANGASALANNQNGNDNTAVGYQALLNNTTANNNSAVGYQALKFNTTGASNVAQGYQALQDNTTANNNVAVGYQTLQGNTTGSGSTALGYQALNSNTTGVQNTALGNNALFYNTSSVATFGTITGGSGYTNGTYNNVTMTDVSGPMGTAPVANITVAGGAVTSVVLVSGGTGVDTTTVLSAAAASIGGTGSGFSVPVATVTAGTGNIAVGYQAGVTATSANANTTGSHDTFIGYNSGPGVATQLQNATAIGTYSVVNQSDSLVLGCVSGTNNCTANTKVGIDNATPAHTLDVAGDALFKNSSNSITAFQIQDASANTLFNVDSINRQITLGVTGTSPISMTTPGVNGSYASTPDSVANSVTGDIDLIAKIAPVDWSPSATQEIIAKDNSTTSQASYEFFLNNSSGQLKLGLSNTGTAYTIATSSTGTGFINGSIHWVRVTWQASSGNVNFYTSSDGVTWSALGTTQNILPASSIFDGTAALEVGAHTTSGSADFNGNIYQAQVWSGFSDAGGTLKANFNAADAPTMSSTSWTASTTGETWTLNGTAALSENSATLFTPTAATFNTTAMYQNSTNSTTAFQIQNAANTSNLFIADTVNSRIGLGVAPITTAGSGLLQVGAASSTTAAQGISFGGDTVANLYRTAAGVLKSDGGLQVGAQVIAQSGTVNQVNLGSNCSGTAASICLDNDTNLYRSAAATLKTDGSLIVGTISSGGTNLLCYNGSNQLTTCSAAPGAGSYIFNGTTVQTNANFAIQSTGTTNVTGVIKQNTSQTADLLDFQSSSGAVVAGFTSAGALQGGNGSGSNVAGTSLVINGGQGTGTGNGGNINFQIAKPGTTGSSLNGLNTVASLSGVNGAALFQNSADSTTAFQIQDVSSQSILTVDTSHDIVGIGSVGAVTGTKLAVTTGLIGLTVNETSSSNILQLQQSATDVVDISSTGAATFKNFSNSTTAFQIQNANAADLLNVSTSTTANLVTNGDIEGAGTSGWAADGSSTLSQVTTQQWQGNSSLQVATTTAAGDGAKYTGFTLVGGTQYTLSLYAKVASGSITDVSIGRQDNTTNGEVSCLSAQTVTTSWTQFICRFTTNATINTNYLFIKKTGGSAETFFIDGIQLQTGTGYTAFNSGGALQLSGVVNSPVAFQNKSDSNTAFQVQNSTGGQLLNVDTINGFVQIQAPNNNAGTGASGIAKLVVNSNWTDNAGDEAQILFGENVQNGNSGGKLYFTGVDNKIHLGGLDNVGTTHDVLTFDRSSAGVILQSGDTLTLKSTGANNININPAGTTNTGVLVKPVADSTAAFQIQNAGGTSNLLIADTTNTRIGLGIAPVTTAGSGLLQVGAASSTTAAQGISFGGDTSANLYRLAAGELKTDGRLEANARIVASHLNSTGQVELGAIGPSSNAAILFGTAEDTNLYRSTTSTLKTDGSLIVGTLGNTGSTVLCENAGLLATCASSAGSGSYIFNGTTVQTNANFAIQSTGTTNVTALIKQNTSQTADLLQLQDTTGANLQRFDVGGNQEAIGYYNNGVGGIGQFGNLLTFSEQLDNAAWTATNVTVTANDAGSNPAPDGQTTAEKLVTTLAGGTVKQSVTGGNNTYTFSVYVKTNSGTQPIQLRIDSNGTPATGTAASYTATTTWQRFTVTQTFTSGVTTVTPTLIITNNTATVAAWGAQMIQQASSSGTSPQVYVRSTTAAVAASAGVVSNGGLFISSANATDKPLIVQAAPSQTGDLLQVQNSGGNKMIGFDSNGRLQLADGAGGAWDTDLRRNGSATLATDGWFEALGGTFLTDTGYFTQSAAATSGDLFLESKVTGDTVSRFRTYTSGKLEWGAGGASARDTNLYRSAAGLLRTDSNFQVGGTSSSGSTTAFQVQNTSSQGVLTVDSTNSSVGIGTSGALSTAKLYITTGYADTILASNTSTGNLLRLQNNSTDVATIGNTGSALFRNSTDSSTAFQIQSTLGTNTLFRVDTSGGGISMGNLAPRTGPGVLSLYGSGTNGAGSLVYFGDGDTTTNQNVWVGERSGDSDQLQLQGKSGVYITTEGDASMVVANFFGSGTGATGTAEATFDARATFGYDGSTTNAVVQGESGKGIHLNVNGTTTAVQIGPSGNVNVGTRYGSRLFSDDFESGNLKLWDQGTTGAVSINGSNGHESKYAAQINPAGATADAKATIVASSTVYLRAWVKVTSQTSAAADLLAIGDPATATSWTVYRSSGGTVNMWNNTLGAGGFVGSGGSFTTGAWHLIEVQMTTGSGTGTSQVWFDGSLVISQVGNQSNGTTSPASVAIGTAASTVQTYTGYVDAVSADTVSNGNASSLGIDDSFHVGGTATFGSSALFQSTSNTGFQIQDSSGGAALIVDTTQNDVGVGTNPVSNTKFAVLSNNFTAIQGKATGTGDLLDLLNNTGTILQVVNGGATTLKTTSDSAAAFQVLNHSGGHALAVDTLHNTVSINSTPATTTELYIWGGTSNQDLILDQDVGSTADLLDLQHNSTNVLSVTSAGNVKANGASTATTATTSGTGTNTTTVTLTAGAFSNGDVIFIDNAGQDYYTRVVSGGGTATLTVSPAVTFENARTVTKYNVQYLGNDGSTFTGATRSQNSFFQGYFTGGVVTGTGSTTYSDGNINSVNALKLNAASTVIQNSSDSTTALQIQNAAGTALVTADTTNTRLNVVGDVNVGNRYGDRLFSEDFESGNASKWNQFYSSGSSTSAVSSAQAHGGKYAALFTESGCCAAGYAPLTPSTNTTVYSRAYFYMTSHTSGDAILMQLYDKSVVTEYIVLDRDVTTGDLKIFNPATSTFTTSTTLMPLNQWVKLELKVTTGASGAFSVWMNDAPVASLTLTGQTINSGTVGMALFGNENSRTYTEYVDDISIDAGAQTGTSSNLSVDDSLHVGGTASFGNTLLVNGSTLIQPTTDATNAFQVQNAGGASLLNTDSFNQIVSTGGGVLTAPSNGGTTGTWGTSTALGTSCGAGVYGATSAAYNGYIYIMGGSTSGTTATATVCYATLNPSTGAVGTWTSTTNLPGSRYNAASVVYNGYVYVIGGTNGTTDQSTVYYAKLNSNGTISSWNTATSLVAGGAVALQLETAAVNNGYIYVIGGSSGGTLQTAVYYDNVNADGSLGSAWKTTTALSTATAGAATVVNNGYVYEMGGDTTGNTCSGTNTTANYYAPLYADGTIGNWNTTTSLTNGRFGAAGVTWGGYVYVLEGNLAGTGCSPSGVPNQALPINANGTLGAQTSPTSPGTSLFQAPAVTYNGYVYILGGTTDGGTTVSTAVQFATVNGNMGTSASATSLVANGSLTVANANIYGTLQASANVLFKNSANSSTALQVQNASGLTLLGVDTSGTTVNIGVTGTTATASTVNIANTSGSAIQTVNIGSIASTSATLIQGGTSTNAVGIQVGASGTISIGTTSQTTTIKEGNTSASTTVLINGGTGASAITIAPGAGGSVIIGATTGAGTLTLGSSTGAQNVKIGTGTSGANSQTISIGTTASGGAGIETINIGSTNTTTNGLNVVKILAGNQSGNTVANASRTTTDTDSSGIQVSLGDRTSVTAVCSSLGSGTTVPTSGTAYELVDCSGTPIADYAEQYPVAADVQIGDVVTTGTQMVNTYDTTNGNVDWTKVKSQVTQLVKAGQSYQPNVIGIVSDNTGDFSSTGYNIKQEDNPMSVALNGRVPVNVTTENGDIEPGDYLTTSAAHPGYAMKATQSGYVIGQALSSFSGSSTGQVMVFVKNFYYPGPDTSNYIQNGSDANLANLNVASNTTLAGLGVTGATNLSNLNVSGPTTLTSLTVTGDAAVQGTLTVTGNTTVGGSLTVTGLTNVADITINGHVITAGGQPTTQVQTAIGTGATVTVAGTDTTGTITITTGSNPTAGDLAKILFSKTYGQAPHIVLSASNNNAAGLRFFKGATTATDFMFDALDTPQANTTYTFDYFIAQ